MPQCRIVPFFGTFLRDLYAIVNDLPNLVIVGQENEVEKMKFLTDINGDDHVSQQSDKSRSMLASFQFSSSIGVGGLLNADKINLVAVVMENLEVCSFLSIHLNPVRRSSTDTRGKWVAT